MWRSRAWPPPADHQRPRGTANMPTTYRVFLETETLPREAAVALTTCPLPGRRPERSSRPRSRTVPSIEAARSTPAGTSFGLLVITPPPPTTRTCLTTTSTTRPRYTTSTSSTGPPQPPRTDRPFAAGASTPPPGEPHQPARTTARHPLPRGTVPVGSIVTFLDRHRRTVFGTLTELRRATKPSSPLARPADGGCPTPGSGLSRPAPRAERSVSFVLRATWSDIRGHAPAQYRTHGRRTRPPTRGRVIDPTATGTVKRPSADLRRSPRPGSSFGPPRPC